MNGLKFLRWSVGCLIAVLAIIFSFNDSLFAETKKPQPTAPPATEKVASTGAKGQSAEGLGVQEHEAGDVDVVLLEVKRTSGETMTVRWKYVNHSQEKKKLTNQRTGWIDPYRLSLGAYVLDMDNKIKYIVITDPEKRPVAGKHGGQNSFIYLDPKQTLVTWAKFPAVPDGVEKVTVSIPGAAPFEDVPVSK
jgi:hypothetical protein